MSKPQDEVLRYIQANADRFVPQGEPGLAPPDAEREAMLLQYVQENADRLLSTEGGPGFVERHGENLLSILTQLPRQLVGKGSPEDPARIAAIGAGISEGMILKPLQAAAGAAAEISEFINNLPGMRNLPLISIGEGPEGVVPAFRRLEDFALRAREGAITDMEVAAIEAGLSVSEVATAKGFGEFIGFTAPLVASFKIASLLMHTPKLSALRYPLLAHAKEDFVAGAIFGALFVPAEDPTQRLKHTFEEAAIFGVGRLILNSLLFPFVAARSRRFLLMKESGKIDDMMERIRNGEKLVLTEEEAAIVPFLLSEEEYVVNSIGAQIFIERGNAEAALLQGIIDSSSSGSSSGIVRGLGLTFGEVQSAVIKFKTQFPQLKFDVIKSIERGKGYDIVFGTQGLSNIQKQQMARIGRFTDLWLEKNGTNYLFVSEAAFRKGDPRPWINVRTADGKVTQIADDGVTDLFTYQEEIKPTQVLNKMFDDFSKVMDDEINTFTNEGLMTEGDLIKGIRDGTVNIRDEQRRAFTSAGAIVHPEELGLELAGENAVSHITFRKAGEAGIVRKGRLHRVEDTGQWGFIEFPQFPSDPPNRFILLGTTLEEAHGKMLKGEWQAGEVAFTTARAQDVMDAIAKDGIRAGHLNPEVFPYISFDDAVDSWARQRGIPTDAPDFPALKTFFASQYREKMWKSVSKEDMEVFTSIREEFFRLSEAGEIPLTAQAWNKGIHIEKLERGFYGLKDIRTGATITVESEAAARVALKNVHRPERDMLETFMPFEGHGMGGMTGGWEPVAQGLHLGDHVNPAAFLGEKNVPPLMGIRNVRDLFMYIEGKTKFPLFSQVFDELDVGLSRMRAKHEPFALKIQDIWKGLPKRGKGSKYELVDWWADMGDIEMSPIEQIRFLRERGATAKQIRANQRARELWDVGFEMSGLPESRYINNYYSRVRPWAEQHGVAPDMEKIFGKGEIPPEFKFWAEYSRTGDLSIIEKDPELVMHRWFRSLLFKQELGPTFNRARDLVVNKTTPRLKDFPRDIQAEILASNPHVSPNDPILPPQVRKILSEYLNNVRGTPEESVRGIRDFTTRFFNFLNIDADPRVLETFLNTHMSIMYGAAMGLRASIIGRNVTQTVWTQYTRLGGKHGGRALEKAMTMAGYEEPLAFGGIRSSSAGIPQGDALASQLIDETSLRGRGPVSNAVASSLRLLLRTGNVLARTGRKMLLPYSSADDMNRAWSYWWQKYHTEEHLLKFETGKIPWDKFVEDGLPYFSGVTKNKFQKIYNTEGKERALRWIGKIGADEAHWIYGHGAQPALLQKPVGKYVGMFGTWPLWGAEIYFSRMWKGNAKQKAAFTLRTLSIVGIFSNMMAQTGYDLWSWIAPTSMFGWAGGPIIDNTISARGVMTAPLDQKHKALGNLARNVGQLVLPGQMFVNDVRRSLDSDNIGEASLKMFLGKPIDDYNFNLEVIYDPTNLRNHYMFSPPPRGPGPVTRPGGTR